MLRALATASFTVLIAACGARTELLDQGAPAGACVITAPCAAGGRVEVRRGCRDDRDCVVARVTTSCCGTQVIVGLAASEARAFAGTQAQCAMGGRCQCPAGPPWLELDGGRDVAFEVPAATTAVCRAGCCTAVAAPDVARDR